LLSDANERTKMNNMLIKTCKENGFDGLILEVWSQLAGRIDEQILYTLVLQMGKLKILIYFILRPITLSSFTCSQGAAKAAASPHIGNTSTTQGHAKFVW